jgi:hypothetical protein
MSGPVAEKDGGAIRSHHLYRSSSYTPSCEDINNLVAKTFSIADW